VARVKRIFKKLGLTNGLLYLLDQALRRVTSSHALLQRYYLVVQPAEISVRLPKRLGATYQTRFITADDPEVRDLPRPAEVIRDRFAQDSKCIAIYDAAQLVGFIWFCHDEYLEEEVNCRFTPSPADNVAWDFDIYIEPDHRSGIAFLKLWMAGLDYLKSINIQWSASQISAFLPQSLASHRRLGTIVVGQAFFLRIFSLQFTVANVAPFVHIGWGQARGPSITVRAPEPAQQH